MKKICFITNPVSGTRQRKLTDQLVREYLPATQFYFEIIQSEYAGHTSEISRRKVEEQYDVIVAVGGDGSVNEVASQLIGSNTTLGIVPVGSGNGLAGSLGYLRKNPAQALRAIATGNYTRIDVGLCNGKYFLCNAGIGIEGIIVKQFKAQAFRGFLSYAFAASTAYLLKQSELRIHITTDSESYEDDFVVASVFNAREMGYGFGLLKHADLTDGMLDLIAVRKFHWYRLPVVLYYLFTQRGYKLKEAICQRTASVTVRASSAMTGQIDGDHFKWKGELQMKLRPAALSVITP